MKQRVIESGIAVKHLTVLASGTIYASEAAPHDDMPSTIWRFDPNGHKTAVDTGLMNATGVIVTGDHNELFAAESRTHWLYSFEIGQTGELLDKQRYYWLHTAEGADDEDDDSAGTSDLAEDSSGYIYAATRMGVQVCDQNGRVESILTIPDGAVTSLSFFGKNLDTLAVVCGGKLYTRTLNVHGHPGFADVITLPNFGAG
jgi:sugar lactone lactonase YvrE